MKAKMGRSHQSCPLRIVKSVEGQCGHAISWIHSIRQALNALVSLNEDYFQIQLPIKESHFQMEVPGRTEDLYGNVPNSDSIKSSLDTTRQRCRHRSQSKHGRRIVHCARRGPMEAHRQVSESGRQRERPSPCMEPSLRIRNAPTSNPTIKVLPPRRLNVHIRQLRNARLRTSGKPVPIPAYRPRPNLALLHRFRHPDSTIPPPSPPPLYQPRHAEVLLDSLCPTSCSNPPVSFQNSSPTARATPSRSPSPFTAPTPPPPCTSGAYLAKTAPWSVNPRRTCGHNYKYMTRMKRYWGMFSLYGGRASRIFIVPLRTRIEGRRSMRGRTGLCRVVCSDDTPLPRAENGVWEREAEHRR